MSIFNKNFFILIRGEIKRSVKYKVLTVGTGVSFIWLIVIYFLRKNYLEMQTVIPMLIFADTVLMPVILIGASIFFEKQEGSVRSLLVSPLSEWQIIIGKIVNSVFTSIISSTIVLVGALLMTNIRINILLFYLYIILITSAHAAIGFALSLVSRDFNSMLVNYMLFYFLFIMPPILIMFNLIPSKYEIIALISPSEGANILLNSIINNQGAEWYMILISIVYLAVITFVLMKWFVYPRFRRDGAGS